MILMLHVFIALASCGLAFWGLVAPTKRLFAVTYSAIGLTLATGIYLVIAEPARMMHVCMAGLGYLAVVSVALIGAHVRLRRISHRRAL